MTRLLRLLLALVLTALAGPVLARAPAGRTTILVSIDGFRADYLDRGLTPTLSALAHAGVRARAMHPSFPSLTFPNHYTLVTGLRPDEHGIVSNTMEDPNIPGVTFKLSNREALGDRRWWDQAEPLWVTAEKQGVRTATMFWPGSEAPIGGVRPQDWKPYQKSMPASDRVDAVLSWLDRPAASRPRLITLYFEHVDVVGHHDGPDSAEINDAIREADAGIGRLVSGLRTRGLLGKVDLVIVSDHGMAFVPVDHRIFLDDLVPLDAVRPIALETIAGFAAVPGREAEAERDLVGRHDHVTCYHKTELPARLHYGRNPRIPPIICIPEAGWQMTTRATFARQSHVSLGEHGYDPADASMNALFVGHGPDFRHGVVLAPFDNVDVYPLLARLIHVRARPNDGRLADLRRGLIAR